VKKLVLTISNREDIKQVVRSSGSVGANYIEANESLGKKDFLMHIKICRKEAKESYYWLSLLDMDGAEHAISELQQLMNESTELRRIFGAIITKYKES
jgi:four helix bundle protein